MPSHPYHNQDPLCDCVTHCVSWSASMLTNRAKWISLHRRLIWMQVGLRSQMDVRAFVCVCAEVGPICPAVSTGTQEFKWLDVDLVASPRLHLSLRATGSERERIGGRREKKK